MPTRIDATFQNAQSITLDAFTPPAGVATPFKDATIRVGKDAFRVSFAGDGWAQMFDPYTEAETYFAPMILRFITGKEPIEKFDEYSQKAMDMGFAEARDKMQEAYNTQHGLPEGTGISK